MLLLPIQRKNKITTVFTVPAAGAEGTAVAMEAEATDPAGVNDPLTFTWTVTRPDTSTFTLDGASVGFTPEDDGSYSVSLAVDDGDGGLATQGSTVAVANVDPIVSPDRAGSWWEDGLRVVSLSHYGQSAYAFGTGTEGGLTEAGRELLHEMEGVGMVLDLTHLSEPAFWEALDAYDGPVLASHNNCRALVPGDRQFSDAQIDTRHRRA